MQRSRIVGVAQFAQIPLLNDKQLRCTLAAAGSANLRLRQPSVTHRCPLLRWHVPHRSHGWPPEGLHHPDDQSDRTHHAHGRWASCRFPLSIAKPVHPLPEQNVSVSPKKQSILRQATGADGTAIFTAPEVTKPAKVAPQNERRRWRSGKQQLTQIASGFLREAGKTWPSLRRGRTASTTRPSSRSRLTPTPTAPCTVRATPVHFRSVLRDHNGDALSIPKLQTSSRRHHRQTTARLSSRKNLPISAMGSVHGELVHPRRRKPRLSYNIAISSPERRAMSADRPRFRVEDYRKPEYQVRVSVSKDARAAGRQQSGHHRSTLLLRRSQSPVRRSSIESSRRRTTGGVIHADDDTNSPGLSAGGEESETDNSS